MRRRCGTPACATVEMRAKTMLAFPEWWGWLRRNGVAVEGGAEDLYRTAPAAPGASEHLTQRNFSSVAGSHAQR